MRAMLEKSSLGHTKWAKSPLFLFEKVPSKLMATEIDQNKACSKKNLDLLALENKLIELTTSWIQTLGYRTIYLELLRNPTKIRVFIDFLQKNQQFIGIEDCVRVTHALEAHLDEPEKSLLGDEQVAEILSSNYELEVSSPGTPRPLRLRNDFEAYLGKTAEVTTDPSYPHGLEEGKKLKKKHFQGTLLGTQEDHLLLELLQKPSKKQNTSEAQEKTVIAIPFSLILKANLHEEETLLRKPGKGENSIIKNPIMKESKR